MVWLFALATVAVILYFWLIGHWYARVLMFLVFYAPCFLLGWSQLIQRNPGDSSVVGFVVLILSGTVLWFLSGIPIYLLRVKAVRPLVDYVPADRASPYHAPFDVSQSAQKALTQERSFL